MIVPRLRLLHGCFALPCQGKGSPLGVQGVRLGCNEFGIHWLVRERVGRYGYWESVTYTAFSSCESHRRNPCVSIICGSDKNRRSKRTKTHQHDTILTSHKLRVLPPPGGRSRIPRHSFDEECCTRSEGDGTCRAGGGTRRGRKEGAPHTLQKNGRRCRIAHRRFGFGFLVAIAGPTGEILSNLREIMWSSIIWTRPGNSFHRVCGVRKHDLSCPRKCIHASTTRATANPSSPNRGGGRRRRSRSREGDTTSPTWR
jgi:hypothetical protein